MLTQFGQILAFLILAVVFVVAGILTAKILSPKNPTKEKQTTYECGENPIGNSWIKFNIRFYVIALIFIIFDVEVVFIFPWAVIFQKSGIAVFLEMLIFLLILGIGFVFVWARGDLEWVKPKPVIPKLKRTIIAKEDTKVIVEEITASLPIN